MLRTYQDALLDIHRGFRLRGVWIALAREDIGDQHRRTALGPIWLMINYLIYIGTFLIVFGANTSIPNFPAFVSVGMLVWIFLQEIINLSLSLFQREESFINGTTLPLSVYVMRLTMQSFIRVGYAALGCLAILLFVGTPITWAWLWALVGIAVIAATAPAAIIVFAMAGAFFPDLQFIVSNLMRVSMFITPIFWQHIGGRRDVLYHWNPFTHLIEIVRLPIIGEGMPFHSLKICLLMGAGLWLTALYLLGRYRRQVVFVL